MKTQLYSLALALIASSAVLAQDTTTVKTTTTLPDGSTQTTEKTTTTTSTGTLTEYVPGTTFIVKESTGPVTYRYGKDVAYVTRSGKVITQDMLTSRVRVGTPVSVHYITDGDSRVISRVVVDD